MHWMRSREGSTKQVLVLSSYDLTLAVPLWGGAVNRVLVQAPASRPFGLPSHTPACSACPIEPHNYLASDRAVRQAELHPKLTGIRAFVS